MDELKDQRHAPYLQNPERAYAAEIPKAMPAQMPINPNPEAVVVTSVKDAAIMGTGACQMDNLT